MSKKEVHKENIDAGVELDLESEIELAFQEQGSNIKGNITEFVNNPDKARIFFDFFNDRCTKIGVADTKGRVRLSIPTYKNINPSDIINFYLEKAGLKLRVKKLSADSNSNQELSSNLVSIGNTLTSIIYGNTSQVRVKFGILSSKKGILEFYPEYTK